MLCGMFTRTVQMAKALKRIIRFTHHTRFLPVQKCHHTRWPRVKHRERQALWSSHSGKQFSQGAVGNPGNPWGLRDQNCFYENTKTLLDLFTLLLSQVYGRDVQKVPDIGYVNRLDA